MALKNIGRTLVIAKT